MQLGRIVLAWLLVAIWFGCATIVTSYLVARIVAPSNGFFVHLGVLKWRLVEAMLLTLIASLWFDSLGSGGWWLLFALVGALVTIPQWFRESPAPLPRQAIFAGVTADMLRYIGAGALLASRLS